MKHPTRFEMILEICKRLNIKHELTKPPAFDSCGEICVDGKWHQIHCWWSLKSTLEKVHKKICEKK